MNTNKSLKFFISVVLFLLFSFTVSAVGIQPSHIKLEFKPYENHSIKFFVEGPEDMQTYVKGSLMEYVEYSGILSEKGQKFFMVNISFPGYLMKESYRITAGVKESVGNQNIVSAATAVQSPIFIDVPQKSKKNVQGSAQDEEIINIEEYNSPYIIAGVVFLLVLMILNLVFYLYRKRK